MIFDDIPIHELVPSYVDVVKEKPQTSKHIWLSFNEGFYNYVDKFTSQPDWFLKTPPWKHSFFYHDAEALLVFDHPQQNPVWICNYTDAENRPWDDELMLSEERIPLPLIDEQIRGEEGDEMEIEYVIDIHGVEKLLPYGIVFWGDFSEFKVKEILGNMTCRILGKELLFARFNLRPGSNTMKFSIGRT